VLVANKCEGRAGAPGLYEAYSLGLGEPVPISAEHGEGMSDLLDALLPIAQKKGLILEDEPEEEPFPPEDEAAEAVDEEDSPERPIHLAIVGRPNVGKSTLVNRLLGEERMLTGPEAGLTRDAIAVDWQHGGRPIKLVDTAGLRRRAHVTDELEKLSVADTLRTIRHAHVVALVLDSEAILDKQDLTIARMVLEEGRALLLVVNKWDKVEDRAMALKRLEDRMATSLPQARGVPALTISALNGKGIDKLMAAVLRIYDVWNRRVSTAQLNRWLEEVTERHAPPLGAGGKRLKLRYMTQVKARPPTFAIFSQRADELPESYARFLVNELRQTFDLPGVPVRLGLRKRRNPYVSE
jgi:GTP-binding protein